MEQSKVFIPTNYINPVLDRVKLKRVLTTSLQELIKGSKDKFVTNRLQKLYNWLPSICIAWSFNKSLDDLVYRPASLFRDTKQ